MVNDIAGFGGLICRLSDLKWTNNKMCNRVLLVSDNFKGLMEMVMMGLLFSMFSRMGLYVMFVCFFFFFKFVN
jgi:hypothetical protein